MSPAGRSHRPRHAARPAARSTSSAGLLRTMSGAFALQTTGAGLSFLAQSALARVLGATVFGQYSLVFNLAQLLATPADLGTSSSVTRFVPQYVVQREHRLLRGLLLAVRVVPVVLGALLGVGALAVLTATGLPGPPALAVVAMLSVLLFALSTVLMNVLRAFGSIVAAFAPLLVLQPVVLLVAVLVVPHPGVVGLAWATVAGLGVAVVLQMAALRTHLRRLEGSDDGRGRSFDLATWREVSLPMLLINVVQLVFQRLDVISVGLLLGAREAGIYAIANRLAVAAASLQKAMLTVVAPTMSSLHASGASAEVEALVLRGLRLVVVPATVVTLVLVVAGRPVLGLISPAYEAGYAALVVYSLGQLFSVAAGPVGWLAAIVGEQRRMARVTVHSALVAAVGYAVLIPAFGIVGAAAANSIGIVYRNVAAGRLSREHGFRISLARAFARRS